MFVRPIGPTDADLVSACVGALFNELRGNPPDTPHDFTRAQARAILAMRDRVFGFALHDTDARHPIGLIMVTESVAFYAKGVYGLITELYIQPEHRSGGHARTLIDAAAELGRRRGWSMLEVGAPSQPKWARTQAFYLKAGFREIGPRLRIDL
ncbi:GNAT family N-acetyltransferase [Bordetella genomosp. 5]|uniref:N-acetyltransferase domain-containing protein n=1 Tax=Bordetella genomosp. 5 TaxID=1395608 RepID=A0A261T8G4_9BORD|nr:GNAT family N-acetyltransferase [Bordetella genomosp. 5]OZI45899.1 hypothetical protein CAL25_22035 [Bordetella genomosp. 5]